jgi:hypothetical protein
VAVGTGHDGVHQVIAALDRRLPDGDAHRRYGY